MLRHAYGASLRAKRDYAMLAMLFGCGFRRFVAERAKLDKENFWLHKFRATFATWSLWAWRRSANCAAMARSL